MGDSFSFTLKKQLKKGVVSCEFLLKANVAEQAEPQNEHAAVNETSQKFPAAGGKKVKKDISRLWKEVVKQVNAENVLSAETAAELRKKCEDYHLHAHSQWFDAWRSCADQVKACITAAASGDFGKARELITEVNHLTKECHRLYK